MNRAPESKAKESLYNEPPRPPLCGQPQGVSDARERSGLMYWCDPKRNIECSQSNCASIGGWCYSTSHEEYAEQDEHGNAMVVMPREAVHIKIAKKMTSLHGGGGL